MFSYFCFISGLSLFVFCSHTVARKDVQEVNIGTLSKPESSNRKGTGPKIIALMLPGQSGISYALFLVFSCQGLKQHSTFYSPDWSLTIGKWT